MSNHMTIKTGKGRHPTIAWAPTFKAKLTHRFTIPAKPASMSDFDARLALAYASQCEREAREAAEIAERTDRFETLYRAILS